MDLFSETAANGRGAVEPSEERRSHDASGLRILLVEDNEMNQQVATELLESAGAQVTIANDGAIAVRILTDNVGRQRSTWY